jgi:RIH domain
VLEKAYIFLIKFVRNNRENQLILMERLDEFLEDVEYGVHAFELIAEILKNNEKLSSFNLTSIIKKVCQLSDDLSIEAPKKATLISFLSYFMYCNGVVLKENQSMILNEITNSSRKNSLHLFTAETGFEQLELYVEEMRRHYASIA